MRVLRRENHMDAYVKAALVLVVIAFFVVRHRKKDAEATVVEPEDWREGEREQLSTRPSSTTRERLTEIQDVALNSASLGYILYAEGKFQRGPDELETYSFRTIDSLVKRGFLESNGSGGYVITQAGRDVLKSNSGF